MTTTSTKNETSSATLIQRDYGDIYVTSRNYANYRMGMQSKEFEFEIHLV